MHRWLCTTAPLLIGSIAVGTIHAAPGTEGCLRKQAWPRSQGDLREATPVLHLPLPAEAADRVRLCARCHDGSVARVNVDMRDEYDIGVDAANAPAPIGVRP